MKAFSLDLLFSVDREVLKQYDFMNSMFYKSSTATGRLN
jgi:hypothetical protein